MASYEESELCTGTYRSRDPIKHFKLRIKLRQAKSSFIPLPKTPKPEARQEESHTPKTTESGEEVEERTFSWQEKVFSPFEVSHYSHPGNCHSPLEEKYHRDVLEQYDGAVPTNRLFSYVDADEFFTTEEAGHKSTTDISEQRTFLADKMLGLHQRQKFGHKRFHRNGFVVPKRNVVDSLPTNDAKIQRHLPEASEETMYILADLSTRESENWYGKDEYVLCTIRYNSNGALTMTPDFTKDNVPYRIEVDSDARNIYEYWIEHASPGITEDDEGKENAALNEIYTHHLQICQMKVGTEFEQPPSGILDLYIMGEIVSAERFDYDNLFVHYFFDLPTGWSTSSQHQLSGVTQRANASVCDGKDVAYFCHPFSLKLSFHLEHLQQDSGASPSWPQLFVEVLSLDYWQRYRTEGYGYVNLQSFPGSHQLSINTWRPLLPGPAGAMRRFFLGGTPELEDVSYVGLPSTFEGNALSKYGFRTITSGVVTVRLNVIQQSQAFVSPEKQKASHSLLLERLSASTLLRSVNAVLAAFKKARERMMKAKQDLDVK